MCKFYLVRDVMPVDVLLNGFEGSVQHFEVHRPTARFAQGTVHHHQLRAGRKHVTVPTSGHGGVKQHLPVKQRQFLYQKLRFFACLALKMNKKKQKQFSSAIN